MISGGPRIDLPSFDILETFRNGTDSTKFPRDCFRTEILSHSWCPTHLVSRYKPLSKAF